MSDLGPAREKTLAEYLDALPVEHLARRQHLEMLALLEAKDAEIARLRSGIQDVQDAVASRLANLTAPGDDARREAEREVIKAAGPLPYDERRFAGRLRSGATHRDNGWFFTHDSAVEFLAIAESQAKQIKWLTDLAFAPDGTLYRLTGKPEGDEKETSNA